MIYIFYCAILIHIYDTNLQNEQRAAQKVLETAGEGIMTDRELKKLSRVELLELLLAESKENDRLRAQLKEANKKLKSREILIKDSGSIAEAALKLNGVFEAAERAAEQYLENIRRMAEESNDEKGNAS